MSTIGGDDVLLPAIVREFKSFSDITDLLYEDDDFVPAIFQNRMQGTIEGSSMCGIVLWTRGGDVGPHINYWSRRLVVDVIADSDRRDGAVIRANAGDKAWAVQRVVHPILHRPYGGNITFANLKVLTSMCATGPTRRDIEDAEAMVILRTEYEIQM